MYEYKPVDAARKEIRVLVVHPGPNEAPVRTTLQHTLFEASTAAYETISYAWGDPTVRSSILVDDKLLDVPASAERVIRRVRRETDRTIWIDAVCINQEDLDERGHQVSLMGNIYNRSVGNIVWLGDSKESSPAAIATLDALWDEILRETDNLRTLARDIARIEQCSAFSLELRPLLEFFSSLWFRRLWCIQEVALAPTSVLLYGPFELQFMKLVRAGAWCCSKAHFLAADEDWRDFIIAFEPAWLLYNLLDYERRKHLSLPTGPKLSLLNVFSFSSYSTSDPRDRLYSLLGLIQIDDRYPQPLVSQLLTPDYNKSYPKVVRDATLLMLMTVSESSAVLQHVRHGGPDSWDNEPFPSWVPRLHSGIDQRVDQIPLSLGDEGADAYPTGPKTPGRSFIATSDPYVIDFKGFLLSRISSISGIFTEECLDNANESTARLCQIMAMAGLSSAEATGDRIRSLARTLVTARMLRAPSGGFDPADFLEWVKAVQRLSPRMLLERFPMQAHIRADERPDIPGRFTSLYNDAFNTFSANRRFFITEDSQMGIGPPDMELSDVVVVVQRQKVPLIFRPNGKLRSKLEHYFYDSTSEQYVWGESLADAEEFAFVGECYVDGIMHGEAAAAHRNRGDKDRDFYVR